MSFEQKWNDLKRHTFEEVMPRDALIDSSVRYALMQEASLGAFERDILKGVSSLRGQVLHVESVTTNNWVVREFPTINRDARLSAGEFFRVRVRIDILHSMIPKVCRASNPKRGVIEMYPLFLCNKVAIEGINVGDVVVVNFSKGPEEGAQVDGHIQAVFEKGIGNYEGDDTLPNSTTLCDALEELFEGVGRGSEPPAVPADAPSPVDDAAESLRPRRQEVTEVFKGPGPLGNSQAFVTDEYNLTRPHPVEKTAGRDGRLGTDDDQPVIRAHKGIDLRTRYGASPTDGHQPIYAVFDGTVEDIGGGNNDRWGLYVKIKSNDGNFQAQYCHLSARATNLNVGDPVYNGLEDEQATSPTFLGMTGRSGTYINSEGNRVPAVTGPHLHFIIFENGQERNPRDYIPAQYFSSPSTTRNATEGYVQSIPYVSEPDSDLARSLPFRVRGAGGDLSVFNPQSPPPGEPIVDTATGQVIGPLEEAE